MATLTCVKCGRPLDRTAPLADDEEGPFCLDCEEQTRPAPEEPFSTDE